MSYRIASVNVRDQTSIYKFQNLAQITAPCSS